MSVYDFNPDVCLQVLYGIAEEIPSGVSGRDLKGIDPKIKFTQELLSFIQNSVITIIKKVVHGMWNNYSIPRKLKCLREMEEKSPNCDAWRPTTGKVNLNSILAKNLKKRKRKLLKEIELVREESAVILPYLKAFSHQTGQQLEGIDLVEKKYIVV